MVARRAVVAVCSVILCVGVVMLLQVDRNANTAGDGMLRIELAETREPTNSSVAAAPPTKALSWFGQVMQHISGGLGNLSKTNSTSCAEGDSCGEIRRLGSPIQIVSHLSDNWLFRNPHDYEPHSFCGTFSDLSETELRLCVDHFVAALAIVKKGLHLPETSNFANGSNTDTNRSNTDGSVNSVGYAGRLRQCYDAGRSQQAKEICLDAIHELFQGQLAYDCINVKTPERRRQCARARGEYENVMKVVENQHVEPNDMANITRILELQKEMEAREADERRQTTDFVEGLKPKLEDQLKEAQDWTRQGQDILDGVEGKLNVSTSEASMNLTRLLGPALAFPALDASIDKMLEDRIAEAKAGALPPLPPLAPLDVAAAGGGEGAGASGEGGGEEAAAVAQVAGGGEGERRAAEGASVGGGREEARAGGIDGFLERLRHSVVREGEGEGEGGRAQRQARSVQHQIAVEAAGGGRREAEGGSGTERMVRREGIDEFLDKLRHSVVEGQVGGSEVRMGAGVGGAGGAGLAGLSVGGVRERQQTLREGGGAHSSHDLAWSSRLH